MFESHFLGKKSNSNNFSMTTGDRSVSTNTHIGRKRSHSLGLFSTQPMATPMANSLSMNSPHDTVISEMDKKIRELRFSLNTEIPGSPETVGGINPSTRIRREDENIYDPYDGQSIGLMVPGSFSEDEDDVWTHLMKIRTLQCEIARLHTAMENAGENDRFGEQGEDVPMDIEEDVKAAKAAEFAKLSDKFNERKVAINGIMAKVLAVTYS